MRIYVDLGDLEYIHEVLRGISPGRGGRFVGPALVAAGKPIAAQASRTRLFTRRYGLGNRDKRRRKSLAQNIRSQAISGVFGGQRGKNFAAYVRAGYPHAHLVELGQPGTPKARPYRGGPQRADPRPFLQDATNKATPQARQAFEANLIKRFPALARQLEKRAARLAGGRRYRPGRPLGGAAANMARRHSLRRNRRR